MNPPLSWTPDWEAVAEMGAAAAAALCLLLHCGLVLGQRVDRWGQVDHWNFLSRAGWYAQAYSLLCNTQGSHYYVARKIKVKYGGLKIQQDQFEVSIRNKMATERAGEIRGQFYLLAGVRGAGEGQCLLWRPAVSGTELEQPLHHTVQQQGEIVITPEVKSPPTSDLVKPRP